MPWHETEVYINEECIPVTVDFNYYPGEPEVNRYGNGDPGHPATAPEVELNYILDGNNDSIMLKVSGSDIDRIIEEIILIATSK